MTWLVAAAMVAPTLTAAADDTVAPRLRLLTTADPDGPKAHHLGLSWNAGDATRLHASWTASVGGIEHAGETVLLASIGPAWRMRMGPFEAAASLSPTLLSRSSLPGKNLGSAVHFTTAISFGWWSARVRGLYLGFRTQHVSNGGIGRVNPGLNSYGFEIEYHRARRRSHP